MKKSELYHKSIKSLVAGYMNDTLKHGDCEACAVGNILLETAREVGVPNCRWANLFITKNKTVQIVAKPNHCLTNIFGLIAERSVMEQLNLKTTIDEGYKLINASGYSKQELMKIEYAFETAPEGNGDEDWMYNGLMSVVEVLGEIHEVEKVETEKSKLLFVK